MAIKPRFERPASNARHPDAHRYDVFGPKVGREVTLFGLAALHAWIFLEADPAVEAYCERPLIIPESKRAADFWFRKTDSEGFILLLKESERADEGMENKLPKAVRAWVDSGTNVVHLINPEEQARADSFLENWQWIIQDVSAFSRYLPATLADEICGGVKDESTLEVLEREFLAVEPVLVRVAVFWLLHRGRLACPQLEHSAINESTVFAQP